MATKVKKDLSNPGRTLLTSPGDLTLAMGSFLRKEVVTEGERCVLTLQNGFRSRDLPQS